MTTGLHTFMGPPGGGEDGYGPSVQHHDATILTWISHDQGVAR